MAYVKEIAHPHLKGYNIRAELNPHSDHISLDYKILDPNGRALIPPSKDNPLLKSMHRNAMDIALEATIKGIDFKDPARANDDYLFSDRFHTSASEKNTPEHVTEVLENLLETKGFSKTTFTAKEGKTTPSLGPRL